MSNRSIGQFANRGKRELGFVRLAWKMEVRCSKSLDWMKVAELGCADA